jgi:hypothetical protein
MDAIKLILDFLFGGFIRLEHYISTWWEHATAAGFSPSIGSMVFISIVMAILCASGFAAMTIAELRQRSRPLHFALGLALPIAYPIFIHYTMPIPAEKVREKEEEEESRQEHLGEPAGDAIPDSELKTYKKMKEIEEDIGSFKGPFDQRFFEYMSRDEAGRPQGPFILEMTEGGRILEINSIVSALPAVVAVETGEGENAKTLRIPYDKIKSFNTKEAWLEEAMGEDLDEDDEDDEE